jgi:hypothetical protein
MNQYANEKPRLDLAQYFGGQTTGWGMVQDRFGNVTRRFVVQIDGRFDGDQGTLDEKFEWSDGEKQQRIWRLKKLKGKPQGISVAMSYAGSTPWPSQSKGPPCTCSLTM